jgi:hypothetical protein
MALRHGGAFNRDEICPIDTASANSPELAAIRARILSLQSAH